MGKRSEVPVTERREAVLIILRRKELGALIARRYRVAEDAVYYGWDDFLTAREEALAGGTRNRICGHDRQTGAPDRETQPGDRRVDDRQPSPKKVSSRSR